MMVPVTLIMEDLIVQVMALELVDTPTSKCLHLVYAEERRHN